MSWVLSMLWGLSLARGVPPVDVVQQLGEGVRVNWSTLQIEVDASAYSPTVASLRAVEQLARREVEAAIQHNVGGIPVTSELELEALLQDDDLGPSLRARVSRWIVREATYGSSGRVWLRAELSLQDTLKPWVLARAQPHDASLEPAGAYTGLIIDVRGQRARPAYAPRILDAQHHVLFDSALDEIQAVTEPPFLFVSDPAHPAATCAGARPLIVAATLAQRSDLVLSRADAERVVGAIEVLRRGHIVVVVDAS
ncbi:MAG TPA: hypothetical protein ENK18_15415 [Deltaproteobacteria bacterium]|nr:hypothetical protein [Deltaproteobacteria bacterium]